MKLEGIHHITAITEDAQRNVDFYAGVLGLRLVKKTVNQDSPTVYHLFFADEGGDAGSDLTFFEYPGAPPGRAGAGMVHRIVWRVASEDSLAFWAERLAANGVETERATAPACGSPTRRGSTTSCSWSTSWTRRWSPSTPRSRPSWRCRASTPCAPTALRPRPAAACWRRSSSSGSTAPGKLAARNAAAAISRRAAGRARPAGRRQRPSRRLGLDARGAHAVAGEGDLGRRAADAGDRPLLLPLDLLPRAERRPLRGGDARPGLHRRRAARASRREALAAARLRAPAGRGRTAT